MRPFSMFTKLLLTKQGRYFFSRAVERTRGKRCIYGAQVGQKEARILTRVTAFVIEGG